MFFYTVVYFLSLGKGNAPVIPEMMVSYGHWHSVFFLDQSKINVLVSCRECTRLSILCLRNISSLFYLNRVYYPPL